MTEKRNSFDFDLDGVEVQATSDVTVLKQERGPKGSKYTSLDEKVVGLVVGQILTIPVPEDQRKEFRSALAQRCSTVWRKMRFVKDGGDAEARVDRRVLDLDYAVVTTTVGVGIKCIESNYSDEDYERDEENRKARIAGKKKAAKAKAASGAVDTDDDEELFDEDDDLDLDV